MGSSRDNPHSNEVYIDLLWDEGALLVTENQFTLKSGLKSHVYANHRSLICDPNILGFLAGGLADLATKAYGDNTVLCAVDSSASPYLAAAAAQVKGLAIVNYRPINREKGVPGVIFRQGDLMSHADAVASPLVLVDDVVTTSATIDDALMDLEFGGLTVDGVVCLLDRRSSEEISNTTVPVLALANLVDVLDRGLSRGLVPPALVSIARRERQEISSP